MGNGFEEISTGGKTVAVERVVLRIGLDLWVEVRITGDFVGPGVRHVDLGTKCSSEGFVPLTSKQERKQR